MKRYYELIVCVAAVLCSSTACERLSVDEKPENAPVIQTFSPKKAPAGAEVVVTGEFLNNVTAAYIGKEKVDIIEKVSDKRLSIRVSSTVTKGKIILENATGTGSSEEDFESAFAVPEITNGLVQSSADMGEEIIIQGTYLNSVKEVLFTSEGYQGHPAEIIQQQDAEIVVTVPFVETSQAKIILTYFDGGEEPVSTSWENAPVIEVIKPEISFDTFTFERTAVGKSISLTGENLHLVEKITVKENGDENAKTFDALFNTTDDGKTLSFTVPAGDYEDGDHHVTLTATWFDGNVQENLSEDFVIYVPYVKFWENIKAYCQARTELNQFRSFFSPETGILYPNSQWKELDAVSYSHGGLLWGANADEGSANSPKPGLISDEEYDSVFPYFFFSAVNFDGEKKGQVQVNGPANSNGQLKNFYINASNPSGTKADDNRVAGNGNKAVGTPILTFRYLDSSNANENKIIEMVKNGTVEHIDEATFPIDVTNKTIADISVSAPNGALNTDSWCSGYTLYPPRDTPDYQVDAVILVMYYSNYGYDKASPVSNIKRLGLLHIKTMDWLTYETNSATTYANSTVTFDCYWQKYDYDYSKLQ